MMGDLSDRGDIVMVMAVELYGEKFLMVDPIPMVAPIPMLDLIPMVDPIPMLDLIPMVDPISKADNREIRCCETSICAVPSIIAVLQYLKEITTCRKILYDKAILPSSSVTGKDLRRTRHEGATSLC